MTSRTRARPSHAAGVFGDLRADGFRITRWNGRDQADARHWFDANSLILCLNLSGTGTFHAHAADALPPGKMVIAVAPSRKPHLECVRDIHHRFVVIEMRRPWVSRWFAGSVDALRKPVRQFLAEPKSKVATTDFAPMSPPVSALASDVLEPPDLTATWACWHHAKAMELAARALVAPEERELFCQRTKRIARERVAKIRGILLADLENPPSLTELGRSVGCSPFYLSRTFRQETGATISHFLRQARLRRAAELLQTGSANVTEAAMSVGYSSLSHFSKAFAEAFGCCPCLYGRRAARPETAAS